MSERSYDFVTGYVDISLRVARQGERRIALDQTDLLVDTWFEVNVVSGTLEAFQTERTSIKKDQLRVVGMLKSKESW